MGLTIDTSILVDFFTKSRELLKVAKGKPVYCPKLILAEILGVLVRYNVKLANLVRNVIMGK